MDNSNRSVASSIENIINSFDENLFSYMSNIGKLSNAELCNDAKMKWVFTDVPHLLFNNVINVQIEQDILDSTILYLIEKAKSRKVPLLWWISPTTKPSDLGNHLVKYGFVNEGQTPGMAIKLSSLKDNFKFPTGLTIQKVNNNESAGVWSKTFAEGFGLPEFVIEATRNTIDAADPKTTIAYLGWINGKPVATLLLILAGGVAGMYNISTIPSARQQGIGTCMTYTGLQDAREKGYKVSILEATTMGVSIYRKLGFQEVCQINTFVWTP